jgi:S-adenosyl-L-methionine hydrolase (adenosine-forming)
VSGYRFRHISFLSDYGSTDEFAGVCRGVILRIAPETTVIDVTHGIRPQDVHEGALVLARSVSYLPVGVHLAVVDPGVGSGRLPIAVVAADGSVLVGPDNGLLLPAAARLGGPVAAHCIENPEVMLPNPSRTFHGRDVFAPAAAHLALGLDPAELGRPLAPDTLVQVLIPPGRRHHDHFHGKVQHVDRFGNLQLNIPGSDLAAAGLAIGTLLEVRIEGRRILVPFRETYASVERGQLVLAEDSDGLISLAVSHGSAQESLGASVGASIILGPPNTEINPDAAP